MRYTYECVVERDGDGWSARFPQLGSATTCGDTVEEAVSEAGDLLTLLLSNYADEGKEPPRAADVARVVSVSVELTDAAVEETRYMTQSDAAEYLGVSRARVSALVREGVLDSKWFEGVRKVLIDSVRRYGDSPHKVDSKLRDIDETFDAMGVTREMADAVPDGEVEFE